MRIGTWNVEYGRGSRNADRLRLLAKEHPADIWTLTETHRDIDLSKTHKAVMSEPRPRGGKVKEENTWVTIWSRFRMVRRIEVPDPRRMVAAVFDTPKGSMAVAGVVLPWSSDIGDDAKKPAVKHGHEYKRVLGDQVPPLIKSLRIEATDWRVFAGDFNTYLAERQIWGPKTERIALTNLLAKEGLICHTAEEPDLMPYGVPRTLIDHVCTDLGPTVAVEKWSGDDGRKPRLSDHCGVVVSFAD